MTLLALVAFALVQLVALVVWCACRYPVVMRGHEVALPAFTVQED